MGARPLAGPGWLDRAAALAAVAGSGLLAGWLAGGGHANLSAGLAAAGAWLTAAGIWWLGTALAQAAGYDGRRARALGAIPLWPWLVSWPLLLQALIDPLARSQLLAARTAASAYLLAWPIAGLAALALWLRLAAPSAGESQRASGNEERLLAHRAAQDSAPRAQPASVTGTWWLAAILLMLAAASYWNGAILDPLQFRGFPDYVTQMKGARKLLAGALPYDPSIRVWTDVNLPPITLLLLFAPFARLSELAGKLAYFGLNHLAFFAGLGVLLIAIRPGEPTAPALPALPAGKPCGDEPGQALSREYAMPPALPATLLIAAALTFEPWHDSLRLGQQNGIVFCFLAIAAAALVRGREALSGIALALALIGKPSSALLGIYFLFAGRWRAALAAAAMGLAAFLATLPWTGLESWRFYLLQKAPEILAGTPQQSNVALLALHARLFLPADALSSFDAMPALPVAQLLTRAAQVLGLLALWRLVRPDRPRDDWRGTYLEFGVALVLSLSLVGHAWQSYVTWLIIALAPLADPEVWAAVPGAARGWLVALAGFCYAAIALDDVALYKVVGNTTALGAIFASAPNVALLVLAFVLAALLQAKDAPAAARVASIDHLMREGGQT